MAFDLHGNFHNDGFFGINLEEVDVQHGVLDGLELEFFHHGVAFFAVEFHLDGKDVRCVDKFTNVFGLNSDVGSDDAAFGVDFHEFLTGAESLFVGQFNDFAAVEHCGDFAFGTECLHCLFAQVFAGFGLQFKCLHFFKYLCYSK